jgi:hypothetical protein
MSAVLIAVAFLAPQKALSAERPPGARPTSMPVSALTPSKWVPTLSSRARQIYRQSLSAGHDARLFTLAGDSNSTYSRYLGRIVSGAFDARQYPALQATIARFEPSFTHQSVAVGGGFRAADMFDSAKTAPGCQADEGLFACELRVSNASIVFILLGTGDKFAWREFEANYRAMIDYAVRNNVLPVLVTKADDIESIQGGASDGYINGVIRRLALEYQLPLVDLWAATRNLPTIPNPELPHRPFTQHGLHDEWGLYFHLTDEARPFISCSRFRCLQISDEVIKFAGCRLQVEKFELFNLQQATRRGSHANDKTVQPDVARSARGRRSCQSSVAIARRVYPPIGGRHLQHPAAGPSLAGED